MSGYVRQAGTADVSIDVFFFTIATGAPVTVTSATSGLDIDYRRPGATNQNFPTLNDLSALDDAHNDGGILLIGNGVHRLDLPDAACAAGAPHVSIHGTATGIAMVPVTILLSAYDPFDSMRLGLTSLPTAAPGGIDGMPLLQNLFYALATGTVESVTDGGDMVLSAGFSDEDTTYEGMFLGFFDGPAAPQFRFINVGNYDGGTHQILFDGSAPYAHRPFNPAPAAGNGAIIFGFGGLIPVA